MLELYLSLYNDTFVFVYTEKIWAGYINGLNCHNTHFPIIRNNINMSISGEPYLHIPLYVYVCLQKEFEQIS